MGSNIEKLVFLLDQVVYPVVITYSDISYICQISFYQLVSLLFTLCMYTADKPKCSNNSSSMNSIILSFMYLRLTVHLLLDHTAFQLFINCNGSTILPCAFGV